MKGFSYQNLAHTSYTRILVLEPGEIGDGLRCSLQDIDDWAGPGYYAISYVWGPPRSEVPIICNGQECLVTESLAQALRRFRRPTERTHLWADAICINQDDEEERSAQVARMGEIYAQATQVWAWLGTEDAESLLVVRLLKAHLKKAAEPWFHVRTEFEADAPEWSAMVRWLNQPWFWRVWTIQEARLAKSAILYFGPHSIDLRIVDTVLKLHIHRDENENMAGHLDEAFRLPGLSVRLNEDIFSNNVAGNLLSYLLQARRHQATDPRDKVFGLLGLPNISKTDILQDKLIRPDYTKSTETVYHHAAMYLIKHTRSLRVLKAVDHGKAFVHSPTFPSWAPQWNLPNGPILLGERSGLFFSSREPHEMLLEIESLTGDERFLRVRAAIGTSVRAILPAMSLSDLRPKQTIGGSTIFDELWEKLRSYYGSPTYVGGDDLILAFIKLLTMGLNGRGENSSSTYTDFFETLHWMWGHDVDEIEFHADSSSTDDESGEEEEEEEEDSQTWDRRRQRMLKAANTGPYARVNPGRCQQCSNRQIQNSPTSLHSYLTMSPKCELLGDDCTDIYTFNYRIRDFFRGYTPGDSHTRLQFQAPCIDACNYRRLFVTADQHIGLSPQAMSTDDMIAWLEGMPDDSYGHASGSNAACVLRKSQLPDDDATEDVVDAIPKGESYHFIGNAYIHGLCEPGASAVYRPITLI